VIASHSSARHFTPGWERNISDPMIERVAASGGLVMVTFGAAFLRAEYRPLDDEAQQQARAEMERRGLQRGDPETLAFFSEARRSHGIGTVEDIADHIDHMVGLVGARHVGLGSDFDGVFGLPADLQDVSEYPNLTAALLRRGYAEDDIAGILGENTLRVWDDIASG
jgi:membrane dipeptidase